MQLPDTWLHADSDSVCVALQNVAALKQLMEEVATLKAEREVVIKELKDPISDISEWSVGLPKEICANKLSDD